MGVKVDAETSAIEVDGCAIRSAAKVYYLLNKPKGVLSTTADEFGRATVLHLLPGEKRRLFPVGRLDEDTEGLIILTNDGDLANVLTHPRYGVPKVYSAKLRGIITREAVDKLKKGFRLEDGRAKAERVYITHKGKDLSSVRLTMLEGRNHIVRRMMAKVGFPVRNLRRDRIAFLTLHGLGKGDSRKLSPQEVGRLYEYRDKPQGHVAGNARGDDRPARVGRKVMRLDNDTD
jgi:23S rRNA pseudouridine2605 synthase